ncbi:TNF receptor-associated factor 4-like [Dysidea avara]|uniref:TNF receptor-associated factor 4-like n=1 Tax=Dysidea avara TaxID=196820 RepID=UPI00331D53AA
MATSRGGYDYKFVNTPPDRLVCNICHLPSRDPYLTTCCGHVFCKFCLDCVKNPVTVSKSVCPVCREEEFSAYVNKQLDREIRNLHVTCTNTERGCEWQGELNHINNHLGNSDGCQFEDVKCSNECGKMLQRRYLASHVETECPCYKIDCQYCHITGGNWFIEGEHKEQCPKLPLPCPNSCMVSDAASCPYSIRNRNRRHARAARSVIQCIPRENMEGHKKECPLQEVKCPHKCGKVLQRQNLTSHVETECPCRKVDCQYCHIKGEHQFIEGEHKEQCPKFPLSCPNRCEVESVLREDMEAHRKECPLEVVQCEYHNVGCEERMMRKRKREHEEEKMEEHLSLTKHSLTQEVADTKLQLAGALEKIDTLNLVLHQALGLTSYFSGAVSNFSFTKRWTELTTKSMLTKSGDQICPVVVRITAMREKKNNQVHWYSHSFYSHDKGYKMCMRVDAAGHNHGKGTHLSMSLFLMKGPHDDELTWPLREKFEVKLLNQISDCEHRKSTVCFSDHVTVAGRVTDGTIATKGRGRQKFISSKSLHDVTPTCQYLRDDCIFLQVSKL